MSFTDDNRAFASDALSLPQRSVLADEVYEILRSSLLARRIEPGARLNLDRLARELHVSNTPVRQALARLESDGLVTKEPYRGFLASPLLDDTTIRELYDYRLIIEPVLAARAATHRSEPALARLDALCDADETGRMAHDPNGGDALGERDVEFHCLVAEEAGNRLIADNVRATMVRMTRYTVFHRPDAAEQAWAEHRAVVRALADGDEEGAAEAMRTHLRVALDRMHAAVV